MKKLLTLLTIFVLLFTVCTASASAVVIGRPISHYRVDPETEERISCSGFEVIMHSDCDVLENGMHELEDGSMCYVTSLRMEHTVKCSTCEGIVYRFTEICQYYHSLCGEQQTCPY